jgi:serine/threonine-protein kinase
MEYLEGQPLDRLLNRAHKRDGGIRKDLGYVIVSDMLAGLHHAHELRDYDGEPLNVVHRDVSPHNVFITYDGQVKVVDFGIARASNRATYTATGVVKGKVFYMAPEQALGEALDRRGDVFSAGILLWEVAVGKRMWADKDDVRVLHQLTSGSYPVSPKEAVPSVPDAIDAICRKALARDPEDRYPTAAAMLADLDRVIHDLRTSGSMAHGHANHELGEYVAELFGDDRQEIQGKIERQMKALAEATHPELIEAVQISRRITPSADQEAPTELHEAADSGISSATDAPIVAGLKASPSSRRMWLVAAVAVLAVGGAALALNKDDAPAPAAEPQASAPTQAPSEASASEQTVRVHLSIAPSDAVVTLDGRRLDGNPFDARLPRDDRAHTLTIEAEGHETESRTIGLANDVDLRIELKPADKKTARSTKTSRAAASAEPQPSAKGIGVKTTRTIDTSDPYGTGKQAP